MEGGSKVYQWSVSDEDIATVDNEGLITIHNGPGEVIVKAAMPNSPHNYDQIKVRETFYNLPSTNMNIC